MELIGALGPEDF